MGQQYWCNKCEVAYEKHQAHLHEHVEYPEAEEVKGIPALVVKDIPVRKRGRPAKVRKS